MVVTGSDIFCFKGDGAPPVVHSFRLDTKGFFELAGISHLGSPRLRFVMEDPTQLLSGSVASYVLGQLALGKTPADVAVPGLTGVTYPPSAS